MKTSVPTFMIAWIGLVGLTALLSVGCQKRAAIAESEVASADAAAQPADSDVALESPRKGGAQVWSENCMRCHNFRPPRERSDREWEIIAHHMRVRANLTAEEHRLILAFLKAAN